ncbi:MAG: helix-turn-helix domain-containing protein [Acutalibacteraceae bacterium]
MTRKENNALQMIAEAARCPEYGPDMVKALMKKLDMNEKGFALLMNVTPSTVRLWTSGAADPCGTARRLMQIYETAPEIIGRIAGEQEDVNAKPTA